MPAADALAATPMDKSSDMAHVTARDFFRISLIPPNRAPNEHEDPFRRFSRCQRAAATAHEVLAERVSRSRPYLPGFDMVGEGFEPSKAEPTGLQPVPFDRSGIPPERA